MKKIISVVIILIFCTAMSACATVEYTISDNFDFTVTQQYSIKLDKTYLESKGYNVIDMKEFLFEFFGFYATANLLPQDDIKSDSITHRSDQNRMNWTLEYVTNPNKDEYFVIYSLNFDDEQAFSDYYGASDSGENENITIEKSFLYYRIIQDIDSPFELISEEWKQDYSAASSEISPDIDFADIFIQGLKNGQDQLIFEGFRQRFPAIEQSDIDKLLYRFVYAYARGMMENTADYKAVQGMQTYMVWDRDNTNMADKIQMVTLKPNSVGWNILLLIITAIFAGILTGAAILIKKRRPKTTPLPPTYPHVPPSVFGEEYR